MTLAFAVAMGLLFAGVSITLYYREAGVLLDELDTGLRFRAEAFEATAPQLPQLAQPAVGLVEPKESFAQLLDAQGRLIASSPGITAALLSKGDLRAARTAVFFTREVAGVSGEVRLLALPLVRSASRDVLVVGASMSDRTDALHEFKVFLGIALPLAILLALLIGWLVAGLALRPVERMRREASAISASGTDRRLALPSARDEIRRLGLTLNEMLNRLDEAMQSERKVLDRASHELRTPLTALKAEVDIALSRSRSVEELTEALTSVSEEADRMARLADDLLVLARANAGRLPVHREPVSLQELLSGSARMFRAQAVSRSVRIEADTQDLRLDVDGMRVRQAIDNLIDNALRFSPPGAVVRVEAKVVSGAEVRLVVTDDGPGFPNDGANRAHLQQTGLGLAVARAVAESHGGTLSTTNRPGGGAEVTLTLRDAVVTASG